ncbi:hypothetical protein [Candidatus Protochlamydia sp. R18]|uniref:hypothetical protein n=1 Tax=Candidatus Protochlamydia sp. R18 TaxID=1353977 RepID=UPI0005A96DAE|nr:hypothetical protein [Candidatus Protochlamydia sp. R18]
MIKNDSSFSDVPRSYQINREQVIQNKIQLDKIYEQLKTSKNSKEFVVMHDALTNLNHSMAKLKEDIEKIKIISKDDELSKKVWNTANSQDIFTALDSSRLLIQNAQESYQLSLQILQNHMPSSLHTTEPKNEFSISYVLFDKLWQKENVLPESFLEMGQSLVELYQKNPTQLELLTRAHQCWEKAAELYEKNKNYSQAFEIRAKIANEITIPHTHPLYELESKVDDYVKNANIAPDDGAKFDHLDSGILKRGMLSIRKRNLDGKEKLVANFHISHFAKEKLLSTIKAIRENKEEFIKNLPEHLKSQLTIRDVDNGYFKKISDVYSSDISQGMRLGKAIEIEFKDIGVIRVAADNEFHSMRDRIVIEVNKNTSSGLEQMSAISTVMGLGPIFGVESFEEEERKKIMLLFRTFYPQEAYPLENLQDTYEISIESLKQMIIDRQPDMKEVFKDYLSGEGKMKKVEIAPNASVWSVPNLADLLRHEGAIGLMAGFTGDPEVLVSVLTQGSLCSQERFEKGHNFDGTSAGQDHRHGGAGFVFSRLINQKMVNTLREELIESTGSYEERPSSLVQRYPHYGEYQLLYDLSVINTGAYAYNQDRYGSKSIEHYGKRNNLIEFTKSLDENSIKNEVMIRDRLPPDKLHKILFSSESKKQMLIDDLKEKNLIIEEKGKHYIKGYKSKSIEELFVVGKYFTSDMWK